VSSIYIPNYRTVQTERNLKLTHKLRHGVENCTWLVSAGATVDYDEWEALNCRNQSFKERGKRLTVPTLVW
jgi:hypothetical protein